MRFVPCYPIWINIMALWVPYLPCLRISTHKNLGFEAVNSISPALTSPKIITFACICKTKKALLISLLIMWWLINLPNDSFVAVPLQIWHFQSSVVFSISLYIVVSLTMMIKSFPEVDPLLKRINYHLMT
jgi:hypothetical protein